MNRRELLAQTAALLPARPANRRQEDAPEGSRAGFKVSNSADGQTAELWLYSEIGGWFGVYAEDVIDELRQIQAPNILVRMSSPGGDVFDGIAIGNALAQHPARVTVQVDSIAASIASVIAVTAGDEVVMASNAQMMIHNASGMCGGGAAEFRAFADLLDKIGGIIAQCYADRAGGDPAQWAEAMAAETWYTAQEAVDAGLADRILPAKGKAAPPADDAAEDDADFAAAAGWRYPSRAQAPAPRIAAKASRPVDAAAPAPDATLLAQALGYFTSIDATVDLACKTLSEALGVPNPDQDAPDDDMTAKAKGGLIPTPRDLFGQDAGPELIVASNPVPDVEDEAPDAGGVAVSQEVSDNLPADPQTSTTDSSTDQTDPLARLRASLTTSDPLTRLREATK